MWAYSWISDFQGYLFSLLITVTFVLSHYFSNYWYKNTLAYKSLVEKAKTSKYSDLAF